MKWYIIIYIIKVTKDKKGNSMRGNINKKYLRRRKNWFQRNYGLLIVIAIITAIICGATVYFLDRFGIIGKDTNQEIVEVVDKSNIETETRAVQWINDEPKSTVTSYTVPEGVQYPYFIRVNRAMNCVTVYGIDSDGQYTIPVKAFTCSVGSDGQETIIGENYTTTDKYEWGWIGDNLYAQYVFRIEGDYLFSSVPYTNMSKNSMDVTLFNKLGEPASSGCIYMAVADIKWIYDNCPSGSKVTIYDDITVPGPLGKPDTIKIVQDSPNSGWDPTDSDGGNPWLNSGVTISGAKDITAKIGEKVDIKSGVKAIDTCGNDITDKIITIGRYTFDQVGEYDIKYQVVDAIGNKAQVTVKLKVTE